MTSDDKQVLPDKECSRDFLTYSVNPTEPCYIALSGCGPPHLLKERYDEAENNDVIADTCTILEATPRDKKDVEYCGVYFADFSPEGNSLVYYIYSNRIDRDANQIALITDILNR
ncbi:hypothetical protein GF359_01820 [candidate division WOR-3 bacterium]|uniref:Uncharacterized protein n=1 Tax=candidate division WOR-3 bacterium TaxID=2052148 RepID=A0A9D5K7U7_UNCW3|nr:hypothetical protein [candidate division WOR-3 bacterium]MBD3363931.1 hypothetical protein [candidate division WOR-3 bacterium]